MATSGMTPKETSSDAAVTLIEASAMVGGRTLAVINEGDVGGWVSADGGVIWRRLPAGAVRLLQPSNGQPVLLKRDAGGSDVTDVYADVE